MLTALLLTASLVFSSPVHYPISLAGNYAEPRPNHFHGGIDIKTGQAEGKPLFSVADGYVAAVSMGICGYGNALYICHTNGTTSQYCHLKAFAPRIAAMARAWLYKHRQNGGMVKFRPTDLPISRGDLVAISGNTGSSQAPHLHLEIHDTRSWDMLDPLDFLGSYVADHLAPMAHGFMVYPQEGEGTFCNGADKQSFGFAGHNLTRRFYAWGKVGFALWANDYSEVTYNRLGVRKVEFFVDGKLQFSSETTRIPSTENMQVNAWGDYEHYMRYGVWYMRSFLRPGVTLPIFQTNENRGIIDFNQERDYNMKYVLTDYKGNKSVYTFVVTARKTAFHKRALSHPLFTLYWNRPNVFNYLGMSLSVGRGYLADNVVLRPVVKHVEGGLSDEYRLMPISTPMFHYGRIAIRLKNKNVSNPRQLYIEGNNGISHYCDGIYQNGYVVGKARDLGATYCVKRDAEAPRLNAVNIEGWGTRKEIKMGIIDNESGVRKFAGYVDGKFIVFEEVPKSPWYRCDLSLMPIHKTGKIHIFRFVAEDNCGNKREFKTQFKY